MKSKKPFVSIALILIITASFLITAHAQNEIRIFINDEEVATDQAPVLVNDRTLVPIRVIAENENLQCEVKWDEGTQTVKICTQYLKCIDITIGSDKAVTYFQDWESNGEKENMQEIQLDAPAQIINDRTMVPLRFVGEALSYNVNWLGQYNSIYMYQLAGDPETRQVSSMDQALQKVKDYVAQIGSFHDSYDVGVESNSDYWLIYGINEDFYSAAYKVYVLSGEVVVGPTEGGLDWDGTDTDQPFDINIAYEAAEKWLMDYYSNDENMFLMYDDFENPEMLYDENGAKYFVFGVCWAAPDVELTGNTKWLYGIRVYEDGNVYQDIVS